MTFFTPTSFPQGGCPTHASVYGKYGNYGNYGNKKNGYGESKKLYFLNPFRNDRAGGNERAFGVVDTTMGRLDRRAVEAHCGTTLSGNGSFGSTKYFP
jgi:hypothetical protein